MSLQQIDQPGPTFARQLRRGSWFAALGAPLTESESEDAHAFGLLLGLPINGISTVRTWRDAEAVTRAADWSREWWDREQSSQAELRAQAAAKHSEAAMLRALTSVTDAANAVVMGAAAVAAARDGIADESLIRVAAGAATQACHQAALVDLAGAGEHAFAVKYRLYAAGRWPLGITGGRFHVF